MLEPSEHSSLFQKSGEIRLHEKSAVDVDPHTRKTAKSHTKLSLTPCSQSVPLVSLLLTFACNAVLAGSIPATAQNDLKSIQKRHPPTSSAAFAAVAPSSGDSSADELQLKSICFPAQFVQDSTIRDFKRWSLTTKGRDEAIRPSGLLTTAKADGLSSLNAAYSAHNALGDEAARVRSRRVAGARSRIRGNRGHPEPVKPKRSRTKRRIPKHLHSPTFDGHHFLRRDGKANIVPIMSRGINQPDFSRCMIECPSSLSGTSRYFCPSKDENDNDVCIEIDQLCDGVPNCPNDEDEDPQSCFFHRPVRAKKNPTFALT